ncbi:MAG: hypothetical protein K2N94_08975 [Lachnospiraceae bacterium]|nr:hypothetical protein [Lachnospiraceae bacterium]
MANDDWDFQRRITAIMIHGFAAAHAAVAFTLSQTMVGDELALAGLTVAMIECIARVNDRKWGVGEALATIGVMSGGYIGTRLGVALIKWIPGLGNGANAAATFATTEILGWIAYTLVKQNKSPSKLTKKEKEELKKEAENLKNDKTGEELYEKMSAEDKKEFNELMKQFRKIGRKDDAAREPVIAQLEELIKKYG